jgi:two-component system sensor histidine kinase BarA
MSLLLGSYFTSKRISDLDSLLYERGLAFTQQLSPTCEYGMLSGSSAILQNIANSALDEKDVRSVSIYDQFGVKLIHSGPTKLPKSQGETRIYNQTHVLKTSGSLRFKAPVYVQSLIADGVHERYRNGKTDKQKPHDTNIIGWVELELSVANTLLSQYETLIASISLIFLGLICNILLALKMSRDVTDPIIDIIHTVDKLADGNLEARADTNTEGELSQLAMGINAMSSSLQDAQEEMQHSIDQATEDVRETLETIEVQNIELDMARKEALQASRIKSEFLANMSHEIRTPLNGIIGFTRLLKKTTLDTGQKDYLSTIDKSSAGLLTIINDILDFSKIEAGKLVLDAVPLQLRDIIDDVLVMLAPEAHAKALDVSSLIYSDVPDSLVGDPLRIKQILTNLINNAIKFTHQGNVVVRAMLEDTRDNDITLKVSVTDTGIGLSQKKQQELFTAFSQADTSTTRQFGGTGLGLVISQHLVEKMHGEVGLESTEGRGSTFWFTLRLGLDNSTVKPSSALANKHIAFYEQHSVSNMSLNHLLKSWQLRITDADNLDTLVSKVSKQDDLDAIIVGLHQQQLSDPLLPEFIQTLASHAPVFTLINSSDRQHFSQLKTMGASLCQSKPYTSHQLMQGLCDLTQTPQQENSFIRSSNQPRKASHEKPRILAVDDNFANLKLITALLEDLGADVVSAASGHEALAANAQNNFDLVFMDIQMPEIDGIETTKIIRQKEMPGSHLPIIALTAHAMSGERERLLKEGMDDYLSKPISESQLQHCIHQWTGFRLENAPQTSLISKPINTESDQLVDLQQGLKLANSKVDLAIDMMQMLLDSLEDDRKIIIKAHREMNINDLLSRVHRLHGATRYCGVPQLRYQAEKLETLLNQDNLENLSPYVNQLLDAIDNIRRWGTDNKWQQKLSAAASIQESTTTASS